MTLKLCSVGGRCVSIGNWYTTVLNVHGVDNVRQTAVQGTNEVLPPLVQCACDVILTVAVHGNALTFLNS
jgi:hypothetical protein